MSDLRSSQSFKSISAFESHYRRHTNHETLNQHHRTHGNEKPFVCEYKSCGQTFHDSVALDQHFDSHTDKSPLICKYDSCGQAFHDFESLIAHHRTHKQRPLVCRWASCTRTFAQRKSLEAHVHMHTKERRFSCTYEGCNKSFCASEGLMQHEKSHTAPSLHPCEHKSCEQIFTKPSELQRHNGEEHSKPQSVDRVRPIRLRLSQPKRQSSESMESAPRKRLVLRPPKKTLRSSSSSNSTKGGESGSESKEIIKRPSTHAERKNVKYNDRPPKSSSSARPISEASIKHRVSGFSSRIPLSVRPQASAWQPINKSRSAQNYNNRPNADGHPGGHSSYWHTTVCGVYSREKWPPYKIKTSGGPHHCPRCDTQFTRSQGVKRHFVGCIAKFGNPDSLRWTDHPSLQRTVEIYAHKERQMQEDPPGVDLRRNEKESRELPKHASLHYLAPHFQTSILEANEGIVEPVTKSSGHGALLQEEDIVRPIHKRQDALRRSRYNPDTICRDVLVAIGKHPVMDPLNAHLDILRENLKFVGCESNMSTFRWDLVDPEQEPEQRPEEPPQQEVRPQPSTPNHSRADGVALKSKHKDIQQLYDAPSFFPSRPAIKSSVLYTVFTPGITHFGPMSTIFSNAFDRDASARLMSSNDELWAAIFTMLEHHNHEKNFEVRAAVRISDGEIMGWVACHEVDTLQARPVNPLTYLDWMTAAHLLPSQLSRFTATRETAEEKAESSSQKKHCQVIASTIQARATEAQILLVPLRRLVINVLVVHPLHQGCGVASALLNSITEIANTRKIPIWIQAPEDPAVAQGVVKAGLFRRAGFMCAGELNEKLVPYASRLQKPDGEKEVPLTAYKWNYMLR